MRCNIRFTQVRRRRIVGRVHGPRTPGVHGHRIVGHRTVGVRGRHTLGPIGGPHILGVHGHHEESQLFTPVITVATITMAVTITVAIITTGGTLRTKAIVILTILATIAVGIIHRTRTKYRLRQQRSLKKTT